MDADELNTAKGPLRCDKCQFTYLKMPLHGEGQPDPVCNKKPAGILRSVPTDDPVLLKAEDRLL